MAIFRGPGRKQDAAANSDKPTRLISGRNEERDDGRKLFEDLDDAASRREAPQRAGVDVRDDGKTRLQHRAHTSSSVDESASKDFMADPVVGWLVVVAGPGRGAHLRLGYGMNGIGRGAQSRVHLDFGDEEVSRSDHATLTYDPRGRKFYLQHGGGTNLTYLNNAPVLAPVEIQHGHRINLGNTELLFVAFCGEQFDWQESASTPSEAPADAS